MIKFFFIKSIGLLFQIIKLLLMRPIFLIFKSDKIKIGRREVIKSAIYLITSVSGGFKKFKSKKREIYIVVQLYRPNINLFNTVITTKDLPEFNLYFKKYMIGNIVGIIDERSFLYLVEFETGKLLVKDPLVLRKLNSTFGSFFTINH